MGVESGREALHIVSERSEADVIQPFGGADHYLQPDVILAVRTHAQAFGTLAHIEPEGVIEAPGFVEVRYSQTNMVDRMHTESVMAAGVETSVQRHDLSS